MKKILLFVSLGLFLIIGKVHAADGNFGGGSGILTDPYLIEDILDLQAMNDNLTAHYALANDIDALATSGWNTGLGFLPVGQWVADGDEPFSGSLDGQNYTILNLYINRPSESYTGLFGWILTDYFVENITLTDLYIVGDTCVGGLIGMNESGSVTNVNVAGFVACANASGAYGGGIIGLNYGAITLCSAHVTVGGGYYIGGLIGYNEDGFIFNSFSEGYVSASYDYSGGFVGYNDGGTISDSRSSAEVESRSYTGGFVGQNYGGIITRSYSTGTVISISEFAGGFVGEHYGGFITQCYSTGSATGSYFTGGFSGNNRGTTENCYSRGSTIRIESSTATETGGFTGLNFRSSIFNCYSTGSVVYEGGINPSDKGFAGGVNTGGAYNMQGNFWDIETSQQETSLGGAIGKTTVEMNTQSTFTDWDFADVWQISLEFNDGYPYLQWQYSAPTQPAFPENVQISISAGVVLITWDEVSDVTSYRIYSSDTPDGEFTEDIEGIFNGTSWSIAGNNSKKFYYVKALKSSD